MSFSKLVDKNGPSDLLNILRYDGSHDILLLGSWADDTVPIEAHKIILSAASTHFRNTFESVGFRNSNTKEYAVAEIDHGNLQAIVNYIYTGELNIENPAAAFIKQILIDADYLGMRGLAGECEDWLIDFLDSDCANIDVVMDMWMFAKQLTRKTVAKAVLGKLKASFSQLAENKLFLGMPGDDLHMLLDEIQVRYVPSGGMGPPRRCPIVKPLVVRSDVLFETTVAWLDRNALAAGSDLVVKLLCDLPLLSLPIDILQKASENQNLGEAPLAMLRQMLKARKIKAALQAEVGDLKRKLEEKNYEEEEDRTDAGSSLSDVEEPESDEENEDATEGFRVVSKTRLVSK